MELNKSDDYVDVIEDGKIVKVTKEYAKREGLTILERRTELIYKRPAINPRNLQLDEPGRRRKTILDLDKYRKPLGYRKNNVIAELKDNFHWDISAARKSRGLLRKSLATALNVTEDDIKKIENGILPSDDFILISKIEKFFGISLRKGSMGYVTSEKEVFDVQKEVNQQEEEIELIDAEKDHII